MEEEHTVAVSKQSLWKYTSFILFGLVLIGALYFFSTSTGNTISGSVINEGNGDGLGVGDDAVQGDADAPVTIIEYSDYQCPYCARFWSQTLPQIEKEYIATGKAKLVFKDFPLGFHQYAQKASEATECVRAQGGDRAYWEMHDKLFANQAQLNDANILKLAKEVGYDVSDCLKKETFRAEVLADMEAGKALGVTGTPAFFVNGKLISGAQPFSVFKQAIDAAL